MLGLSKQKAMEEHRKMWNWIADQYRNGRNDCVASLKDEYINCHTDYSADEIQNVCFCCQYAKEQLQKDGYFYMCDCCPIDWDSEVEDYMCIDRYEMDDSEGLYGELQYLSNRGSHDYEAMAELAEKIANLPEREV